MLLLRDSRRLRTFILPFLILISTAAYSQKTTAPLWKIYYDSGKRYLSTDAAHSLELLKKAEQIGKNDLGIYDDNYLIILIGIAVANEHLKDFDQSLRIYTQTLTLSREVYAANDERVVQALYNLGLITRKVGSLAESSKLLRETMSVSKQKHRNLYALSSTALVINMESAHQLDSALLLCRNVMSSQALNEYESVSFELQLAEGRIQRKLKLYDEAKKTLTALSKQLLARGSAFHELSRSVNIQLSLLDVDAGLYAKAEKEFLQLYRSIKAEKASDVGLMTEITNALAFVYEKLNVHDKAIAYYQEALSYCTDGAGSLRACDAIRNNIAGIYLREQQFDKAIAGFRAYIDSRKDPARFGDPDFLTGLNNLATALRQTGQYEEAIGHFDEIASHLSATGNNSDDFRSTILNNKAVTQTMMGRYEDATSNFQEALKIKQALYAADSPVLMDLYSNLGVALWASGKRAASLPHFEKSLQLGLREVRYNFQNLTETEQVQFYARQKENFERFNTLAVQSASELPSMLVQMFNNQVLLKSLSFFTNRKTAVMVKDLKDPQLSKLIEWKQLRSVQLGQYYQSTLADLKLKNISLTTVESEIDSVDKLIRHRLSNNESDNLISWNDIQGTITDDEASIDIIRFRKYDVMPDKNSVDGRIKTGFTDSIYYAALVTTTKTRNNPELVLLKNGRELESRFYPYYKNTIKFDFEDSISHREYWDAIERRIAGKRNIKLSPDGVFRQINLNTIQDRNGVYNLSKYDIQLSLNPASGFATAPNPIDLNKVVLMGNPLFGMQQAQVAVSSIQSSFSSLPGTQLEISEISKLFKAGPPPVQYLRAEASEFNLKKLKSPGVLHIATHGYFSIDVSYLNEHAKSDHLFQSGLLLSAGKTDAQPTENDGIVTAYDILNLDLSETNLVVLSACETGLGKNEHGEGVHGLQRSFMQAGADDVVISLWRVDDQATKELMIRFYQQLKQKKSANEALRASQIDMMKTEPRRRMWGSFITISSN